MSAVRIPTPEQNDAMVHANRSRYARQYHDVQDAVTDFQVARLRYEAERLSRQPEPCQFCAVDDEADEYPLPLFFAICIGALGLWGATAYATWWLVGTFFWE